MSVLIEACVDAIDAALEAEEGGADRIELCGELLQGGITPSAGLISAVWEGLNIPVVVLIRPRPGDFLYSNAEIDVMLRDIEIAKQLDVEGIALGALTRDGDIDVGSMARLIDAAGKMEVTFHRAFDFTRDRVVALEALIELGVNRVLTSGGANTAEEGIAELKTLVEQAGGRITILAGGSITAANVQAIVSGTAVTEVHVRAARRIESEMRFRPPQVSLVRPQPGAFERVIALASEMARIREALP